MRGLTDEEADAIRGELVWEPEMTEQLSDSEQVVYDRLVERGLLRIVEVWEPADDDPDYEVPVDHFHATDLGRLALRLHEIVRSGVAA